MVDEKLAEIGFEKHHGNGMGHAERGACLHEEDEHGVTEQFGETVL